MKINAMLAPLGAALLLALCGPALALPATIISDTTLFARPRAGATELTGLPQGTLVDLRRCEQMAWCYIDAGGRSGWVPMASLAFEAIPAPGGSGLPGGSTGGGSTPDPTLVGGLADLLGGQNSGPHLAKVAPDVAIARSITKIPPAKAPDQAKLSTKYATPGDGK